MFFEIVLVFCAQAILTQGTSAQCIGAPCAWGAPAAWECTPAATLSASNGPGVAVATGSPLLPAGLSVLSENAYEGTLAVEGALPFLGTVAIKGELPTAGAGVVAYRCGNGVVGITSEDGYGAGIAGPYGYGAIGAPLAGSSLAGASLAGPWAAGPLAGAPLAGWGAPCGAVEAYNPACLAASNGAGLAVSSASPLVPAGVSVQSQNVYEGELAAGGAVPFLGTVAIDGSLCNAGAGAVNYGCGNGAVGITAEDIGAVGFGGLNGPFGYGLGLARSGWGCEAIY